MNRRPVIISATLLLGGLLLAPSAVQYDERSSDSRLLDDIPGAQAQEFALLANPARGMQDLLIDTRSDMRRRRISAPITPRMPLAFSPTDRLVRYENRHLNLRGGRVSRFLSIVIWINCGEDAHLEEALSAEGGSTTDVINDIMQEIFSPLTFNDIRSPSQKNDLRERMIIDLNERFHTGSIRDIYYDSFIVF